MFYGPTRGISRWVDMPSDITSVPRSYHLTAWCLRMLLNSTTEPRIVLGFGRNQGRGWEWVGDIINTKWYHFSSNLTISYHLTARCLKMFLNLTTEPRMMFDFGRFFWVFFLGGGEVGAGGKEMGGIHYHTVIIHVSRNTDYFWVEKQNVCHTHWNSI